MDFDANQYMNLFIEESTEYLKSMNEVLLELEKDTKNISLVNEIFRIAHTLKGMTGTMGYTNLADLTHEMENVLDKIRNKEISLNGDIVDILFECFDTLDESIAYIADNAEENDGDNSELINKLEDVVNKDNNQQIEFNKNNANNKSMLDIKLDEHILNAIYKANKERLNVFNIHITLSSNSVLKSARAFVIFNSLEPMGDIIYSNPPTEDIEDEKFDFDFKFIYITKDNQESLYEKLYSVSEVENVEITLIEEMEYKETEITKAEKIDKKDYTDNKDKKDIKSTNNTKSKTKYNKVGKTVRVDIEKLDNLMNLVSELIIIKNRMEDLSGTLNTNDMVQVIEYLERITTNLNDAVMKVRMVPIERVFNRFPRMVRDLSKNLNKEINLEMYGENTEVDRTVIDEIGDPLVHIIRNSIDHGIEKPEERTRLGKPEKGSVILKAYPDGNNVVIEVSDDGSGINFNKVKDKAIQNGVITNEEADILSEDELKNLIFNPGFSTSAEVTEVSGRGVGLDVVKNKIESINGNIELESEETKGTKFIIKIPLTLAIIQALLVNLNEEIYAIPLSSIIEVISVRQGEIKDVQNQEIMLYRGRTIPIIRLDKLMDVELDGPIDEYTGIVVRKGKQEATLLVTNLLGQQEIVIKPLGKFLSNIKYLSGATILGNGKISLILDVNSLL